VAIAASALTSHAPETITTIAGGLLAAAALSALLAVFQERVMKSIFELVPADQQPELQQFLAGTDMAAGVGGQQADLSAYDPAQVARELKQRIVGQDEIVNEVVATTFRRAKLIRPAKPLATFLFVGPTGCGKSELSKAMADVLFAGRVLNLPLNQMKKAEDLWALIGPPPGYMGSDRGGKLCRDLGRLGTGVLVLDEIEKAHPDIIQALMRLLDEGQLTEQSTGAVFSARGFVIVGTSNAAANAIGEIAAAEIDPDIKAAKVRGALTDSGFPPEIVSRFDAIYPFPPLSRSAVAQIVCLMAEKHAKAAGVELVSVDGGLLMDMIRKQEKGADVGMRGLDRAVERAVLDGLLEVRKSGYNQGSIKVIGGKVSVQPVG
jgi:ATP-dependent Clp protease ATP-binding subunit ClpA